MNIEQSILPLLGKTVKIIDLHIEDELSNENIDITKLQFVFLIVIKKNNGKPQQSLAELTGRDKTTFTRNIATLERKNLVTRQCCHTDKRSKLVHITPLGLEYIEKSKPILIKVINELESAITLDEREQFMSTLQKIKQKSLQLGNKENIIFNL